MKIKNFRSNMGCILSVVAGGFILANIFNPEIKSTVRDTSSNVIKTVGNTYIDLAEKYIDLFPESMRKIPKEVEDTASEEISIVTPTEEEIVEATQEETVTVTEEASEEKEEPVEVIYPEYQDTYLLDQGYEFKDLDFDAFNEINSDVIGYVEIPDTEVSYKVYQRENDVDNDYYLHRDENGNKSSEGSIYLDSRVDTSLGDDSSTIQNTTLPIFGHHMGAWRQEKMFRDVDSFKNQSYMDSHPYGVYYSEDGSVYALEVVAGFIKCGGYDDNVMVYNLDDINTFNEYVEYINNNALAKSGVSLEYGDKIVNLVTCSYDHKYKKDKEVDHSEDRFVLVCKAVKQYTNENQVQVSEEDQKIRKLK